MAKYTLIVNPLTFRAQKMRIPASISSGNVRTQITGEEEDIKIATMSSVCADIWDTFSGLSISFH